MVYWSWGHFKGNGCQSIHLVADSSGRSGEEGGGGGYTTPRQVRNYVFIVSRDGDSSCADDKIMSYHYTNVPK